jgi:hypothetical protein
MRVMRVGFLSMKSTVISVPSIVGGASGCATWAGAPPAATSMPYLRMSSRPACVSLSSCWA